MREWLRACAPQNTHIAAAERVRMFGGALFGIGLTAFVSRIWLGENAGLPMLVAPMGASAVLLFAVPASPLAQPWPVLGGNIISALAGVTCALLFGHGAVGAATGVAFAILLMSLMRCLHPPGGAVALTAVVGGPVIAGAGYSFALMPVGLNTMLMLMAALLFNNLARHRYPHFADVRHDNPTGTSDVRPDDRIGFDARDLDRALAEYGDMLDISRDDLDVLFRRVEVLAHRRLHGQLTCAQIMSQDVQTLRPDMQAGDARARLLAHRLQALPVIDHSGAVVGLVGIHDVMGGGQEQVSDLMQPPPPLFYPEQPVDELLPALSGGAHDIVAVVDGQRRLVGVVSQTDMLAGLYRQTVMNAVAAQAKERMPSA